MSSLLRRAQEESDEYEAAAAADGGVSSNDDGDDGVGGGVSLSVAVLTARRLYIRSCRIATTLRHQLYAPRLKHSALRAY